FRFARSSRYSAVMTAPSAPSNVKNSPAVRLRKNIKTSSASAPSLLDAFHDCQRPENRFFDRHRCGESGITSAVSQSHFLHFVRVFVEIVRISPAGALIEGNFHACSRFCIDQFQFTTATWFAVFFTPEL